MKFENSLKFAAAMDRNDPLKSFRKSFFVPKVNNKPSLYFTGNSLGLQPVTTKKFVLEELEDWAKLGVEGHFHGRRPWLEYHKQSQKFLAAIVGAKPSEVIAMNQLTVNLHLMMSTFYVPHGKRIKILAEEGAFSSDQYAIESQIAINGYTLEEALIEIKPRAGEYTLRTEDIVRVIHQNRESLALVLLGGVQYYSGQFFDIETITAAAHDAGAPIGFDLAHAVGNVPLQLHKHEVDFAVWCSYKYLNSGPGGIAGAFVHEIYAKDFHLVRLAGWWGHEQKERFQMKKGFKPMAGAEGWQVSNFPVLLGAAHQASLEIFHRAGMKALRTKSILLTGYLEFMLREIPPGKFIIITPENPDERGCQLSILMLQHGKKVFNMLTKKGVIADWREPNVIRVAPVPLYNSYMDVFLFSEIFRKALGS